MISMNIPGFTSHKQKVNDVELFYEIGGQGFPLLMLHGYPETHYMWHKVAPELTRYFTVILPDLRGYGDSSKPVPLPDHSNYCKRTMAKDMIELMRCLGYQSFFLVGHDRGARVAHRFVLDYPEAVKKIVLLDIIPTYDIFLATDKDIAMHHYHWFFLSQAPEIPEKLLLNSAEYYLRETLKRWSKTENAISENTLQEYLRSFKRYETIRAMCEDYRAAASIDLIHDEENINELVMPSLLVLWGRKGAMADHFDVLECWQRRASNVSGYAIDCGHFIPEEAPDETLKAILDFLRK